MQGQSVPFSCDCGQVHGTISDVAPNKGNHLLCYCTSCQTAANVLGYSGTLDQYGGTGVFQTVPSKVTFAAGKDNLACLRLSPKGMLRWYASCCDAPLFTMPDAAWFPLAGLNMARIKSTDRPAVGDIVGVHAPDGAQNVPSSLRGYGVRRAMLRMVWRAIKARLSGDRGQPFFSDKGAVSVVPRVLSLAERRAASPE